MDDNKNQNQTNTATSDYQKILDEYAASVKPEDNQTPQNKTEDESINVSLKETTSAKVEVEKPITPQVSNTLIDDLEKEIIPKIPDEAPEKSSTPELKSINSPQLESPIHPSLAANLESDDEPEKPIVDLPSLPPKEDPKSVNIPAPTLPPETPVDVKPEKSPEEIKAEINRLLTDDETKPTSPDTSNPTKTSSVGKVFFIFALILFLIIAAGLAYFLFLVPSNTTKNKTDNSTPSVTPTLSETNDNSSNESGICELNNKTYQVGESFTSADGCNTCSCSSAGVITCTEMACSATSTVTTSTTKSVSSSTVNGLTTYKNEDLGISFQYPSSFGEINIKNNSGKTGSSYIGTFNKNAKIIFGSISDGFTYTTNTQFMGWTFNRETNTGVFYNSNTNKKEFTIDKTVITRVVGSSEKGAYYYYVKGYDKTSTNNDTVVLVGSTNNKTYPLIAFSIPSEISDSVIDQIFQSFTML